MITLSFSYNRRVVRFEIDERVVHYFDDNWKEGLKIMPSDDNPQTRIALKKMLISRNPKIQAQGLLIVDANSGKNKEEYLACKTEEDIANLIRKDCEKKGLLEIK